MTGFECSGWLYITIYEDSNTALVKLKHTEDHAKYWSVDVPEDVREMIQKESNLSPTQVCNFY